MCFSWCLLFHFRAGRHLGLQVNLTEQYPVSKSSFWFGEEPSLAQENIKACVPRGQPFVFFSYGVLLWNDLTASVSHCLQTLLISSFFQVHKLQIWLVTQSSSFGYNSQTDAVAVTLWLLFYFGKHAGQSLHRAAAEKEKRAWSAWCVFQFIFYDCLHETCIHAQKTIRESLHCTVSTEKQPSTHHKIHKS